MAEGIFNFFTKDEEISLYRKILTREQYGNSDIAEFMTKVSFLVLLKVNRRFLKNLLQMAIFQEN